MRHPVGGDAVDVSFNPCARAGRDKPTSPLSNLQAVSIHAPVRGATSGVILEKT